MSARERATAAWKVGDWCFWDHQLAQVTSVDAEGRVSELSNGFIRGGSLDNRPWIVPVTLQNKVIADSVAAAKDEVYKANGSRILNWPDIADRFRVMWIEYVDASEAGVAEAWKPVEEFKRALLEKLRDIRNEEVDGVRIFGR